MGSFRGLFLFLLVAQSIFAATAPKAVRRAATPSKQPNIVLITLDTTRADRMGFLGSRRGLTPNLDALAQQSVIFTRAYAQVPITTPSHASLLTGTYPQFNHVENLGMPLAKDLPYLPEVLHQHGYRTAAFLGAVILDAKGGPAPGFDRGFDFYDANFHDPAPGQDRYHSFERRAADVVDHALRWMSRNPQRPFFIWLHFYDPHDPYDPPSPFKERYASAPYDGEIAYMDSAVGVFLKALQRQGLFSNSVIAAAADHGEAFGEHGEERHGMFLYDETIHVPFLLKLPAGKFAGKKVDSRVALVDVAPSLLQAAGIAAPDSMQAQSVLPLLETDRAAGDNKVSNADRAIFSETDYPHRSFGWSPLNSWRSGKYLYIQAPKRELYDSSADPEAATNLASSAKAVADTLDTQLSGFRQKTTSAQSESAKLDPEQAAKLRALGYVASDSNASNASGKALIDPKDKIDVANRYHRALAEMEEDQVDKAIAELRDLAEHEPDNFAVQLELGHALDQLGKQAEAIPFLRAAVKQAPDSVMAHLELGDALAVTDQSDEALRELQAAAVIEPNSANIHFQIAKLLTSLGQLPEATKEYKRTIELDPTHFQANLIYGQLLFEQGDTDGSIASLTQAVKIKPQSAQAHMSLARVYGETGQKTKAEREVATAQRLLRGAQR